MPDFWRIGAPHFLKIQWFPLNILIFGQKSCFLGPAIFKIQQPNWFTYFQTFSERFWRLPEESSEIFSISTRFPKRWWIVFSTWPQSMSIKWKLWSNSMCRFIWWYRPLVFFSLLDRFQLNKYNQHFMI